jgi:peptidoglycan/xylan/chitin deacetylase (PgdA/CDA1 family)
MGVFRLTRRITRRDLRVVCYHGFALQDEHEFRPGLFISADAFERRLAYLRRGGYNVLPLGEALERQRAGTLPPDAVCITIDDGFYSTLSVAAPIMKRYEVPSTVYLTTYYVDHQAPIFNLSVAYLFWRTRRTSIDLRGLDIQGLASGVVAWARHSEEERASVVARIVSDAVARLDRHERCELLERLADRTGVAIADVTAHRLFHLMTRDEARAVQAFGVDLQLHTHRHQSPGTMIDAQRELVDNAAVLREITGAEPVHFCYPSGRSTRWNEEWLRRSGIVSATTCLPGFVRRTAAPYQLGRFLDGSDIDQLTFEAEMSGVLELARRLRTWMGRVHRSGAYHVAATGGASRPAAAR